MASKFRIVASRRLGLETCEFDVTVAEGEVLRGETFIIIDSGSPWQYIVTGIRPAGSDTVTLECVTWLVTNGAFVGEWCDSRAMSKSERKMYAKALPPDLH